VVNFTYRRFTPGNEPRFSLNMRLGGPQRGSVPLRKEKNPLLL